MAPGIDTDKVSVGISFNTTKLVEASRLTLKSIWQITLARPRAQYN